ncbi:zinc finger matrin-type protein 1 [Micropterus salmoides]|uniref:zinc finger matrin-type protein 1 n=1 Tax=Micropterus salmoides TaxID=27706 RepID=UPI0018EB138A|nr:zinc finger matrin-type protein 1 [Micropterus salmoides]
MDDTSVCTPLFAESDAQNDTTSTPNAASLTDADKVINTKVDSTQVEGDKSEEELLKGLLTDDYCHVCEAVLLFESQRLSHYEGKKHAQKLRVYLQAKRAEKMNKESTGPQQTMTTDKDHFCELCNMVFSSHVVARSHYEGKVHSKNLRKQGFQPPDRYTEVRTLPSLSRDSPNTDQKSTPEGCMEHLLDPTATITTPSTEVDLMDPDKYCALCAASFNNPQMAVQHYNGRKHQRNQARQDLLKELGDDVQQANSLMCQMCSVQFNSVEMYQAHMQGNKHQIREKKVTDLCKSSQQKVYSTFADELSDYIQVQKARGINPKTSQILPLGDTRNEDEEAEEEEVEVLNKGNITELNKPMPNFPPTSTSPHHSRLGCYNPVKGWHPPYQGPALPSHGWDYNCPPPVLLGSGPPLFSSRPTKRRRRRKQSSSSSYITSSSYSSSTYSSGSSSASDSDDSEYRRREKRRIRRSRRERDRRERDRRARDEESDKEEKRSKRGRRERDNGSGDRRRGEFGESEEERERRRMKRKNHGKRRRREKKNREEDYGAECGEKAIDTLMPEDTMDSRKETEVHIQAEMNVEQGDGGQDEPAKPKHRKEKKKTKEKVDTRTEEEKLWDDSILGC